MWCQTRYFTPDECIYIGNKELEFVLLPNDIRRPNGREYRKLTEVMKMINISKEEIRDKMFFVREENSKQPVAVIKVSDLLEKEVQKNVD